VRRWQIADAAGDERRAAAFASSLTELARERVVLAAAASEPGQDLTRPATTAVGTQDGWIVSGRKVFCTMSPAADVLYASVTYTDDRGRERYGYAMIPRGTPGVLVHDDWDALGMRASGSNSVTFEDVALPRAALRGGFPIGDAAEYIDRNLFAGLLHAAAALGIAESALAHVLAQLARRGDLDPYTQMIAAEADIEVSACRATFSRAATLIDEHYRLSPASYPRRVSPQTAITTRLTLPSATTSTANANGVTAIRRRANTASLMPRSRSASTRARTAAWTDRTGAVTIHPPRTTSRGGARRIVYLISSRPIGREVSSDARLGS
jgi:alkylation response protein AidB-like acyl-CoA dehydrogenase